jgi:hypothetical protein
VPLGGDQRFKVVEAIAKALPSYEELEELLSFEFNKDLRDIAPPSLKRRAVVLAVVRWAEAHDAVPKLTAAARKHNPDNSLLRAVDDLVHTSAEGAKSVAKNKPGDTCSSCVVHQSRVFINRRDFRKHISRMKETGGPRILSVNGSSGLGKSHSLHLISYVVSNTPGSEFGEIDLKRAPSRQIRPDQLVQSLAMKLGFSLENDIFLQEAQEAWWSFNLAGWLASQAETSGKPCWVVLDGFEHQDVPKATHEFIQHLMQACANRDRLRLILLEYHEDRIPADILRDVVVERLKEINETELGQFFADFYEHRGIQQADEPAILASETWAEVQASRGTAEFTRKLAEAVVEKLKLKFPHDGLV